MAVLSIDGSHAIKGNVSLSGSALLASKIIISSMFSNEDVIIDNVPRTKDINDLIILLEQLGCHLEWRGQNILVVNSSGINTYNVSGKYLDDRCLALLMAGPLLYRFGKATFLKQNASKSLPSTIAHLARTWETLGITMSEDENGYYLQSTNLGSNDISLKLNTRLDTQNAILSSVFVLGESNILNASTDFSVDDIIDFLKSMGANITRSETGSIKIVGVDQFRGTKCNISYDTNEAVFFSILALLTKGNVTIDDVDKTRLLSFTKEITAIGGRFEFTGSELRLWDTEQLWQPATIATAIAPGFLSEWQPLMALLFTQIEGESFIYETTKLNNFNYVKDLNIMGAKIDMVQPSFIGKTYVPVDDTYDVEKLGEPFVVARVQGKTPLKGSKLSVNATNMRESLVLLLAALVANGRSEIYGAENILQQYENIDDRLADLGASLTLSSLS